MFFMGISMKVIPKLSANSFASFLLSALVIFDGILIPTTFSFPNASARRTAHTVESSPPDNPRHARLKPVFLK